MQTEMYHLSIYGCVFSLRILVQVIAAF